MNAIEYLLQAFTKEGVTHFFMVPGGHVDPMLSALKNVSSLHAIVAAHEEGATFMADGYAKMSRKFGVAGGIGGPGITNMTTGIATAHVDGTPLFIITGEPSTVWEGRGAFQDASGAGVDAHNILQSITSRRLTLDDTHSLKHHVGMLMRAMLGHATRGPVQLDFPENKQVEEVNFTYQPVPASFYQPRFIDQQSAKQTFNLLRGKNKVMIIAGTGALQSNASNVLLQFAEKFTIPVATTLTAKGLFPEDHPLSLGVFGWFGNQHAIDAVCDGEVEAIIVLGSRLHQSDTLRWLPALKQKNLLIINDVNEANYYANYDPDLFVLGDAHEYLRILTEAAGEERAILTNGAAARAAWLKEIQKNPKCYEIENLRSNEVPIHPARIAYELRKVMPRNTVLFAGEGAGSFIISHYWECYEPDQYFSEVKYFSPMGWSIAAAIGGKLARPDLPVVALVGDGSMLMHGLELQTAARYHVPVIFVLMNNGAHGNPQLRAEKMGAFETKLLELPIHDWVAIAKGLGLEGFRVTDPNELAPTLAKALALNQPVLIDVRSGNPPTPTYLFDRT